MCDTFCIRHDGGTLFAKSSDRPLDEVQLLRWFPARAPQATASATTYVSVPDAGAVALVGSQPSWMWGLEHGINEHGVAIGNEKVWTTDDPRTVPPALLGMDLVRLGLERATSADDALDVMVDLLARHGQGGSGEQHADEPYWSSFLVVDGHTGWVLETSGRSWVAQPVGDGAAISNRLTLGTGWTRSSADVAPDFDWDRLRAPDVPTGLADHRLAATRACVARGTATTPADAVAALRDHGTGPWGAPAPGAAPAEPVPRPGRDDWRDVTVCMHVRGYQRTTASLVAELPADAAAPVRVWATLGNPCVGVYLPFPIDRAGRDAARTDAAGAASTSLPSVLGDRAVWHAFAALSDRVEVVGDDGHQALREVRHVLDPIEHRAWQAADELWSSGSGRSAWTVATESWGAELRRALGELGALTST